MQKLWSLVGSALVIGCSSGSSAPAKQDAGILDSGVVKPSDANARDSLMEAAEATVRDAGQKDVAPDASQDAAQDSPVVASYPAPHPAILQEENLGGPILKSAKIVVITFMGDTLAPSVDDFVDKVAASATYWSGTTAEYGVGPIASVQHVSVSETPNPNLADSDVQAWLTAKLQGPDAGTLDGGAPWPQPDGETLYQIYYPDTVTISEGGGSSCNQFYGYHSDYAIAAGTYVTYSVVARCAPFQGTTLIDSIASVASHELVEAATDPLPQDKPAWAQPDSAHTSWATIAGGELGDLCAGYGNVFYKPSDVPYLVQRTWSNKAAAAGHDPCQPDGNSPYFNAAAVLTENITVADPMLGTYVTQGVKIPVGGTGTVELDLYSDGPTSGPWTVQAFDLSSLFGGTPELQTSFGAQATGTGKNGDKLELSIKVLAGGTGGAEILWIQSTLGQAQSVWIGAVGN